tara:strand:- start:135 stop:326 length:192 start_codon:yes stop_codon:yes gene_type:complete
LLGFKEEIELPFPFFSILSAVNQYGSEAEKPPHSSHETYSNKYPYRLRTKANITGRKVTQFDL